MCCLVLQLDVNPSLSANVTENQQLTKDWDQTWDFRPCLALFLWFNLMPAAVAQKMPDVWVNLAGDPASEVGGLFGLWVDSFRCPDLFFQVFHLVQQAVEKLRAA